MRVAVFSTKPYDRAHLAAANVDSKHQLTFLETRLGAPTARLAADHDAVCAFVNDRVSAQVLNELHELGVRCVVLRSAGFNHVDLVAAADLGIDVARVPAYSPYAVAEHTVALILCLNRKVHKAYNRVREGNFALSGLEGFDLNGRVVGVVGTGKIGTVFARIMRGFGCEVLAFDRVENPECVALGVEYLRFEEVIANSDIVSLHCPLNAETRHIIDASAIDRMKSGAMLINTGRGGLVDTSALVAALKSGKLGALGLDVYEEEEALFFEDHSLDIIQDDVFMRLLTFPNVIVTAHQAFFTADALRNIAETTIYNLDRLQDGTDGAHLVRAPAR